MSTKFFGLLLLPFLIGTAAAQADRAREAQKAIATVIHLAPDGSDILRGNGFLISADGLLVTNYHLVVQAARLQIQLPNGDVYDNVTLKGLDPEGDVALLKIPAFNAPFIPLARRAPPAPGDELQVIPRYDPDLAFAASAGKVVANQTPSAGLDLVVIGMPLDARTKGCPILDAQGNLVGITTLSYQASTGTAVVVAANRLLDLNERPPKNWPLDLMDWSGWSTTEDPVARDALGRLGLRRNLPPPDLRTEKNLRRRLELALAFDPTDSQIRALLARAYINDRDYPRASTQIDQILSKTPASVPILTLKADLLQHMGDFDEARRLYEGIVEQGHKPPHNYDKELHGVLLSNAVHDHKLDSCSGPIYLGAKDFTYRGGYRDRFSTAYGKIEKVTVKRTLRSGQPVYEITLNFAAPVSNEDGTWQKDDFQLRLTEEEARNNLVNYLHKRGIQVIE